MEFWKTGEPWVGCSAVLSQYGATDPDTTKKRGGNEVSSQTSRALEEPDKAGNGNKEIEREVEGSRGAGGVVEVTLSEGKNGDRTEEGRELT